MVTVLKAKRPTRATDIIVTAIIVTAIIVTALLIIAHDRDSHEAPSWRGYNHGNLATAILRELLPRPFVCKCGTIG